MAGRYDEKIVLLGGGSGVYRVARFLKLIRFYLTLIQTVFDHGGHSGQLRDQLDVFAVGDIRRGIRALADDMNPLIRAGYLDHETADGKKPGNDMLATLMVLTKNPIVAINYMCQTFGVKGKVLPISLDISDLVAWMSDGNHIVGEDKIGSRPLSDTSEIASLYLTRPANIYVGSYEEIAQADKIVICPGSPYTSIGANMLVGGFREAISESKAKIIYVMNIMTNHSESRGYTASRFAKTVLKKLDRDKFDEVICNDRLIESHILPYYHRQGADMVEIDTEELAKYTHKITMAPLAEIGAHNAIRHASLVADLIANS